MRLVRALISLAGVALAALPLDILLSIALTLTSTTEDDLVREILPGPAEIIADVSGHLDTFANKNHRHPYQNEWAAWVVEQNKRNDRSYGADGDKIRIEGFPSDVISKHGPPPINGFTYEYWEGDNWARYISWSKDKKSHVLESDYFPFGNKWLAVITFLTPAIAIIAIMILLIRWGFSVNHSLQARRP